jgi:flavin reductase (DIM6/NTAB) family NADH-FMN oxidoreductase RutF
MMNADSKKTVLRMIPYGLYVLTADDGKGNISASTVNWVTQSAFAPPLVVVGVKTDSGTYRTVKAAQAFALNMLGKDHKSLAFTFFKPADLSDGKISGQPFARASPARPF